MLRGCLFSHRFNINRASRIATNSIGLLPANFQNSLIKTSMFPLFLAKHTDIFICLYVYAAPPEYGDTYDRTIKFLTYVTTAEYLAG